MNHISTENRGKSSELTLAAAAADSANELALVTADHSYTFEQLARLSDPLREILPGPCVPVAFTASPTLPCLLQFYACLDTGTPALLLHPRWPENQTSELILRVGAQRLAADSTWASDPPHRGTDLLLPGDQLLVATSGSSGTPKVAVLTSGNLLAAAQASNEVHPLIPDDRWALTLPFAHVGGVSIVTRSLLARTTVVLLNGEPGAEEFASACRRQRVSHLSVVPTQLRRIVDAQPESLADLKLILVGGAALPLTLRDAAVERHLPVRFSYGLTETTAQICSQRTPHVQGSVTMDCGTALPGVELRISDRGLVQARGPQVMAGYFGQPRRAPGTDEWLVTSDKGSIDEAGTVTILGRADSVIISGGENIHPENVEGAVLEIFGWEVCVVGATDEQWGQTLVAVRAGKTEHCIERGVELTPHERRQLKAYLSVFAVPKYWLDVPKLPTLPSGKLDRPRISHLATCALDRGTAFAQGECEGQE